MQSNITFDYSRAMDFVSKEELENIRGQALFAREVLRSESGAGHEYLGWIELPDKYDRTEFDRVRQAADRIRSDSQALIVIGIGGSYLGARAAINFLNHNFYNNLSDSERRGPEIYFAGNNLSGSYLSDLLDVVWNKEFSINVISKSGTTTEPAIAFRFFKDICEKKYGKEGAARRIYATTDRQKGALKTLAETEGYETFVIPDDIGGRYSVLTAVGLLPIAVSGVDISKLMAGAATGRKVALSKNFEENPAIQYAAIRNILFRKGKKVEVMGNYEPSLHYFSEWWKQLFGESEGKEQMGIMPSSMDMTTDLHSLGQYIQDGSRIMFETVLNVAEPRCALEIPEVSQDLDKLNYLAGRDMDFINKSAMIGTILAHIDGGVPNLRVDVRRQDEETLGELFYFFEFACGISGYMMGVNPFNQPGVESYKKNMFALLGKPGFEKESEKIKERIGKKN